MKIQNNVQRVENTLKKVKKLKEKRKKIEKQKTTDITQNNFSMLVTLLNKPQGIKQKL